MAGKKGRSGGARENSGPQPAKLNLKGKRDPLKFLLAVMNDPDAGARLRVDAAKAALPFVHGRKGEGGKKDERQAAAEKAGKGRFAPSAPPKLTAIAGGKAGS